MILQRNLLNRQPVVKVQANRSFYRPGSNPGGRTSSTGGSSSGYGSSNSASSWVSSFSSPSSNSSSSSSSSYKPSSSGSSFQFANPKGPRALIVNTKGGGHAFIGYYLAKELVAKGYCVTIMNDGDKAKVSAKAPYNNYSALENAGIQVVWGNPTKPSTYPAGEFQIVYDNNGKDLESCKPLIDTYKNRVKHFVFVSSAGAYKADPIEPMHIEGDSRKSTAGHVEVENYLREQRVPYTVFQPLYIYGPLTNKDCEQWFVDRIIRDRPVPIPEPGIQLTSLTHVEDVASMLAAVPGNKYAIRQHYNVCSDRAVTFTGIAKAIGKALGKEPKIVLYNPEKIGMGKSGKAEGFPFRTVHFFASPDKARFDLDWKPKHDFLGDVQALVNDYKKQGRQNQSIDFSIDDKILAAVAKEAKTAAPASAPAKTPSYAGASASTARPSSSSGYSYDWNKPAAPASSSSYAASSPASLANRSKSTAGGSGYNPEEDRHSPMWKGGRSSSTGTSSSGWGSSSGRASSSGGGSSNGNSSSSGWGRPSSAGDRTSSSGQEILRNKIYRR
mmetsp:Transcript_28353/g.62316  ORF Transcript_28353/g.62316 Transcript_28353/m.62316 type:complete len:556 (+) Transcript_28353:33-1700(+)|eukprot:CAMPEP_0202900458 /NCGR_PEP_ID=MMETSP1392-20130828/11759_1 /ASSEMBLY_ACC=CAM_ASM_000868 /TAXON_ID=225041 /ORGANISM="Chlamydomonas chlamydogama, Strain SAG 11-48b" /LENGTH=555 /DNA_ID=CAMNT_0049586849 /DNA_START=33 /DNA_END=1700 /DNA_ORIENTATION=-